MKKVVLLGDSIRLSYEEKVKERLADICEIYSPSENCAYTMNVVRCVRDWFANWGQVDLIHYNTGIWDHHRLGADREVLSSPEQYLYLNRRLHRQLTTYTDKLIWATSIPAGDKYEIRGAWGLLADSKEEWNREVALYNDIVSAYLSHEGVHINDLHELVSAHPEYIGEDGIHLTEAGEDAAADQVAAQIRAMLSEGDGKEQENV